MNRILRSVGRPNVLECQTPACRQNGFTKRPEGEGALALPRYTFGLDVVALIGELRLDDREDSDCFS